MSSEAAKQKLETNFYEKDLHSFSSNIFKDQRNPLKIFSTKKLVKRKYLHTTEFGLFLASLASSLCLFDFSI